MWSFINKKNHLIVSTILFFLLGFTKYVAFGDIFIVIVMGITADLDLLFDKHRHLLTHSIILPALTLFGGFTHLELSIILSWGVHLLCDISFKKKRGTYCIIIFKNRFNYRNSNIWLIVNFGLSLILFFLPT